MIPTYDRLVMGVLDAVVFGVLLAEIDRDSGRCRLSIDRLLVRCRLRSPLSVRFEIVSTDLRELLAWQAWLSLLAWEWHGRR